MGTSWTKKEDEILCEYCIEQYVLKKSCSPIGIIVSSCVSNSAFEGREAGSIRMRVSNIKAILEENNIPNTVPLKQLSNFAKQTESILLALLVKHGIRAK